MGKTENTNTEGVTIVHGSSDTNVQKLAGSLLTAIENSTAVEVRAIGAGAVNQMYKAIASARGYVARKGRDLYIRPGFDEVIEEGSEKTKTVMVARLIVM